MQLFEFKATKMISSEYVFIEDSMRNDLDSDENVPSKKNRYI